MADIEQVVADLALVRDARAYRREHFDSSTGKYVGHVRAEDYDAAIDRLLAALPDLIENPVPARRDGSQVSENLRDESRTDAR